MSYIGQGLPADTFQGFTTDKFTGDGTANKAFTLTKEPFSEDTILVTIDGVVQEPTDDFTVSGTTLTLVGTAANNSEINVTHMGGPLPIGGASELDLNGASDKLILDADADTTISADTDDQIDFKAGGTDIMSLTATTVAINDNTTITTDDNTDTLSLISTDADANVGPVLRLYRNSASAVDNDVIGNLIFSGNDTAGNETDYLTFQVNAGDADDGQEDGFMRILMPVASTSTEFVRFSPAEVVFNEGSVDLDFRVEGNGNVNLLVCDAGNDRVGIGEATPDHRFHVRHNVDNNIVAEFEHSEATPEGIHIVFSGGAPDGTSANFLECADTGTTRLRIQSDGDVLNHDGAYGSLSDERIKQDIRDSNSQWEDIKAVKVRNFKKKDDVRQYGDKAWEQIGVIAQELELAGMDKLVKLHNPSPSDIASNSAFGTLYTDSDELPDGKRVGEVKEIKEQVKSVSYSVLYMKAIKALQEAMAKIETLETKVKALEDA